MAINTIHTQNNTQDEIRSETNDLWAPISDEQQAAISGGYQLRDRIVSGPQERIVSRPVEAEEKIGLTERQRRCILSMC